MKSYLELKIVTNNLSEIRELIEYYVELGFDSDGVIQDNDEVYWSFLKINNGLLVEEPLLEN